MRKIKYLVARIFKMNYKSFFTTINKISKKTKKNKFFVFCDIVYCGLKYQAGYCDYDLFEMYNLNKKQRKTIITRGINNDIVKKYNDKNFVQIFDNKLQFNQQFSKYLGRDWLYLDGNNFEEFQEFYNNHKTFIVKPLSECCGKGIEKLSPAKDDLQKVYKRLIKNNQLLVEEVATQMKDIAKFHPSSINTLRVVTLKQKIVVAFLRIGNNNNVVDNFNHGGLVAPVNLSTGIIDYLAIDKKQNVYEKHPLTDEQILWARIPKWPRIKRFCENVAKIIPEVGYVAWDISINEEGPYIIEANNMPGHDLYQLPPHRTDGIGLLPVFKKVMEEENEDTN